MGCGGAKLVSRNAGSWWNELDLIGERWSFRDTGIVGEDGRALANSRQLQGRSTRHLYRQRQGALCVAALRGDARRAGNF
uniref:Uncharacterized protein n=1 Tax=uncultured Rhodospirillales bacterium HF4000_24M03 TaxID=710788 RepID=E0XW10_9PROT|nr:hypothetical protein [uncultured Rhodospirillales bacterium HF4000_24M03]